MQAVILLTVHRRYYELSRAIERIHELRAEFAVAPEIVVVWSQPEVSRFWFFDELLADHKIQHLVGRPALPGECASGPKTYPESYNLRLGLNFIRRSRPMSSVRRGMSIRIPSTVIAIWTLTFRTASGRWCCTGPTAA